jgi:hypothetical protein
LVWRLRAKPGLVTLAPHPQNITRCMR